jgi:hypothetical protein
MKSLKVVSRPQIIFENPAIIGGTSHLIHLIKGAQQAAGR